MDIDDFFEKPGHTIAVLTNYENKIVKDFFYIDCLERTKRKPYSLGTAIVAGSTDGTGWIEPAATQERYLMEPESENIIVHAFIGVSPADARIYTAYESNTIVRNIRGLVTIGSDYGYFTGEDCPYNNPGKASEVIVLKNAHPAYAGFNPRPTGGDTMDIDISIEMARYQVLHINQLAKKDSDYAELLREFQTGKRKSTPFMLGGVNKVLDAPAWLAATHVGGV